MIQIPARKGTKARPPIVEPKNLVHMTLPGNVGLLKIAYFPGAFGVRFAMALDEAIKDLKDKGCDRLIIDLRGNIGGSLAVCGRGQRFRRRPASKTCKSRVD